MTWWGQYAIFSPLCQQKSYVKITFFRVIFQWLHFYCTFIALLLINALMQSISPFPAKFSKVNRLHRFWCNGHCYRRQVESADSRSMIAVTIAPSRFITCSLYHTQFIKNDHCSWLQFISDSLLIHTRSSMDQRFDGLINGSAARWGNRLARAGACV